MAASSDPLQSNLRERFGIDRFWDWQREAIDELLEGNGRVLVIAPTGGGKSLCYQFPASELTGTTLVVSPLIALMDDQVRALNARGIPATYLASNLPAEERRERTAAVQRGEYRLVYVAPERMAHPSVVESLARLKPPLVAIDEAHCISQWGHDFRPDYLRLGRVLERLNPPRVLACTATATPAVREEILEKLGLGDETRQVLRGFARPNLHLCAEEIDGRRARIARIKSALKEALGSPSEPAGGAIVYAGTRRLTDELAAELGGLGYRTAGYHAGLTPEERGEVSEAFAERQLDVVVATNAFGMGIDRADIRTVIHFSAPGSIEAYYQEVGRAGRDGQPAQGLLITGGSDIALRRRLIENPNRDGTPAPAHLVERAWSQFRDLLRYVEAGSCRHDFILRYFGDEQELLGGCGHCDVCERLEEQGGVQRSITEEDAIIVRKALSGVARARRRVGLTTVAQMLRGEENTRMKRHGLDRLSTYGLFKDRSQQWVVALLRRLLTAGLVDITGDQYPLIYLTSQGIQAMKGQAPIRVLLPDDSYGQKKSPKRARKQPQREPPTGMDAELFEELRAERLRIAKEQGVPAYIVCHDRTLMEIAADRPKNRQQLARVAGMGPARMDAYGDRLLEIVAAR